VRWVKWLPNAQGIDASDPHLDPYYAVLQQYHTVLLTHIREEKAVDADEDQRFGNPRLFRRSLDQGVTVLWCTVRVWVPNKILITLAKKFQALNYFCDSWLNVNIKNYCLLIFQLSHR